MSDVGGISDIECKDLESDDPYLDKNGEIDVVFSGALPHWHQDGKIQFITFRLADSLPQSKIREINEWKASFQRLNPLPWDDETQMRYRRILSKGVESLLDNGYGSCVLAYRPVRDIMEMVLDEYDGVLYELYDYVIMPNHVHILLRIMGDLKTDKIIGRLKGRSGFLINRYLRRRGPVWMRESFDRIVRSEDHLKYYIQYIKSNPRHLVPDTYTIMSARR